MGVTGRIHGANSEYVDELASAMNIPCEKVELNSDSFDRWLIEHSLYESTRDQPQIVIYDQFNIEEQFSWRVRRTLPDAVTILDTQDFHSLRDIRERQIRQGGGTIDFDSNRIVPYQSAPPGPSMVSSLTELFLDPRRQPNDPSDLLSRELASILRSDLSLFVSPVETQLLTSSDGVGIPNRGLVTLPITYADEATYAELSSSLYASLSLNPQKYASRSFRDREHYVFVGSARHPPNVDCVRYLKTHVWPMLRRLHGEDSHVELHIYGSHLTRDVTDLDSPETGFRIRGSAKGEVERALSKYRVLLAPLRFGAGVKGKIIDAWRSGLPVVTTSVGAEGLDLAQYRETISPEAPGADPVLADSLAAIYKYIDPNRVKRFAGSLYTDDLGAFVHAAHVMYSNEELFTASRNVNLHVLQRDHGDTAGMDVLRTELERCGLFECDPEKRAASLHRQRRANFLQQMVWSTGLMATELKSRLLSMKNRT